MEAILPQRMERDAFAHLLPHSGPMLLLNRVERWDAAAIECTAISHNDPANPLRINGRLSTIHAMEYGAQAAAIHLFAIAAEGEDAAVAASGERIVFLGVVRDFVFHHEYMDEKPGSELQLRSELFSLAPRIYQYRVTAALDGETVAQGIISLIVGN